MTKPSKILLVRAVARLESLWRPLRQHYAKADVICAERAAAGLLGGGSTAERKASERARAELAAAGCIIGGEVLPAGRRLARRWTWPFEQAELVEALRRIKDLAENRHCLSCGHVPESLIAGSKESDSLGMLQAMLLPCLADGVVESSSTTAGNVFYRLTDLVSPDDVLEVVAARSVDSEGSIDRDLCDVYDATFRATWRKVISSRIRTQDIGQIPAVAEQLQSKRGYYNFDGIPPLFLDPAGTGHN